MSGAVPTRPLGSSQKERMSTLSDLNDQSDAQTDGEHGVQLELLHALCAAAQAKPPSGELGELLAQLVTFSEVHCMSEELLMRLNSYDHFEDHVSDHIRMMDELNAMVAAHGSGNTSLVQDRSPAVLEFIQQHMATRDQRLSEFLRGKPKLRPAF